MRICLRCRLLNPIEDYPVKPRSRYKDGLHPWCLYCRREKQREYKAKYNADPRRRAEIKEQSLRSARKRRKEVPDQWAARRRRYRYGVELKDYQAQLERQGGICAIEGCGRPATDLDHDHKCCPADRNQRGCGRCFRGVLCNWCNTALARAGDDIDKLNAMIRYLEDWPRLRPVMGFESTPLGRQCYRCKQFRPLWDYRPHATGRDGLHPWCRACRQEKARESYAKSLMVTGVNLH